LITKFQIKLNHDDELCFEQVMKMRSQEPKFYYEFKRKRTTMLQEKEPKKKELYHVTYMR